MNAHWQNYNEMNRSGPPLPYIQKPFGFSSFPMELLPVPKSWAETTGNLVFFRDHDKVLIVSFLNKPRLLISILGRSLRRA